jgi:hypothetical protein
MKTAENRPVCALLRDPAGPTDEAENFIRGWNFNQRAAVINSGRIAKGVNGLHLKYLEGIERLWNTRTLARSSVKS